MGRRTPEQSVQGPIVDWLKEHDYTKGYPLMYHVRSGQSGEPIGAADIWLSIKGTHIEIEVKSTDGNRTTQQERWERICKLTLIPYTYVNSFESFLEFISQYLD